MQVEIKEILKNEIKAVKRSRNSILVGLAIIVLDIILVISSVFNPYSLLLILPLIIIVRKQLDEFRMKQMILFVSRAMVDKEFFDQINEEIENEQK
jgi:hypothetical protein